MKPKFEYDGNVLQFTSDLAYPVGDVVSTVQLMDETNSGVPRVQTLADDDVVIINLTFDRINLTDREALLNWLQQVVNWQATPFTYTDQYNVSRQVMVYSTEFNFPIVSTNYATGTISLRVLPS